mmetsp:Transcript_20793/g.40660  ORF Transcript_20793/g.40660 Transcript_20793/m.40660 type:complete len:595 (-) Transcript_20793:214-1998(-)
MDNICCDPGSLPQHEVLASMLERMQALERNQNMLLQTIERNQIKLEASLGPFHFDSGESLRNGGSCAFRDMPSANNRAPFKSKLDVDQVQPPLHSDDQDHEGEADDVKSDIVFGNAPSSDDKHEVRVGKNLSYSGNIAHGDSLAAKELDFILSMANRPAVPTSEKLSIMHMPTKHDLERVIDIVAAIAITANALTIGVMMDAPDGDDWTGVKCMFAVLFWMEVLIKIYFFGWRHQYRGTGACSNIFDACLILIDTVDILVSFFKGAIPGGNSILLLRTVRLLRLARLFRIFKAPIFVDLLQMVRGLMAGMTTLLWSVVFFVCFVYVVALIFRASFGPSPTDSTVDKDSMEFYFRNVPRAMLTTFRCSFGDCSTQTGTPIFEFSADRASGAVLGLALSATIFVSSVGLFNIISAVFLERIMAYQSDAEKNKLRERLADNNVWHDNITKFLALMLHFHDQVRINSQGQIVDPRDSFALSPDVFEATVSASLTGLDAEALKAREFSKEVIDRALENSPEAKQILVDLDIEAQDCLSLADTLDKDKSGHIDVLELIQGIRQLRGPLRRSDIVAVDLMIRSLQVKIDELWLHLKRRRIR